ncbi:CUB domain protein [Teladorsagia circumcincta]|uniref:CUB domain protein n=1 Tax=Teladorsagia circumcincta TaxID=45464 RepID=A0A2G9V6X2_TELCI|nr:CUB domain protein [Teladorsagia circumcincta]
MQHITTEEPAINSGRFGFTGCPSNNDFYYNGVISSPYYPKLYPPNTECYYYMTAEPGKVLSFNFTHFDMESCCDYVTIYDGEGIRSPILIQACDNQNGYIWENSTTAGLDGGEGGIGATQAVSRIGGPNATVTSPDKLYTTTQRFALVTFQSDPVIQKTGFQFVYQSVFTATPCNRDIVLMLSGLSTVGSQENFQKQLDFVANVLTPTWQLGPDKIRVVINLVVDADYAVVWTAEDLASNQLLSETVLGLIEDVPDVLQNNNTNLQCIFKYAQGAVSFDVKENKEREGVEKVVIAFVPQNPNDDQDFYEAMEFSHTTRTTDDTKVIIIAMGKDLDTSRLSLLSYGSGFTFHADYDGLGDLVPAVNGALCEHQSPSCGA